MEDRHVVVPGFGQLLKGSKCSADTALYVGVFDGHLTSRSAEIAAARLHEVLAEGAVPCSEKQLGAL